MTTPSIGIGITTRNRPGRAERTANLIWKRSADIEPRIVIVDDASEEPVDGYGYDVHRFDENVGIARAKNKCLELLDGYDHIFLFDDDAYPLVEGWWRPYVESPEPHLMYIFDDLAGNRKLHDIKRIYEDQQHVAYTGPRGVMLYIDAGVVLPVVGGMDPIYGKWGYEHGDWSNRIHSAGLTSWRYADVAGSSDLIYSLDEYEEIERSVDIGDRRALAKRNARIHNQRREIGYTAYVDYIQLPVPAMIGNRDVVITHLYSTQADPQRPGLQLEGGSLAPAEELLNSLKLQDTVVISDTEIAFDFYKTVDLVLSSWSTNIFFQRHLDSWRYLRDHPEVRYVWCVDATDVEMLHEPWSEMIPGILYLGYEPGKVDSNWLRRNHPTNAVQNHIRLHGGDTLLNPGVIGGDRETVMSFLHDMFSYWFDCELRRFLGHEPNEPDLGDMGATQVFGWAHRDHLMTGPRVVTEFRAMDRSGASWWRHK